MARERATLLRKLRETLGQVEMRVNDGSPIAQVTAHLGSAIKIADHLVREEAERPEVEGEGTGE